MAELPVVHDLILLHLCTAVGADCGPDAPGAAVEGVPQLRCVVSGRGALTGRVRLLARCDLTGARLAGPSGQVGRWGPYSEPKAHGTQ